jgi:hypothetical protein
MGRFLDLRSSMNAGSPITAAVPTTPVSLANLPFLIGLASGSRDWRFLQFFDDGICLANDVLEHLNLKHVLSAAGFLICAR